MDLETINREVKAWSDLVSSFIEDSEIGSRDYTIKGNLILRCLNQGNYFEITEEEIKEWSDKLIDINNAAIHVYAALDEPRQLFKFYLIDSESDKRGDYDNTIIEKEFIYNISDKGGTNSKDLIKKLNNSFPKKGESNTVLSEDEITAESLLIRCFEWSLLSTDWLKNQKTANLPLFKIIEIPFIDYTALDLTSGEICFNFFGIIQKNVEPNVQDIEIIVTKSFTFETVISNGEDFSSPRPPFSVESPMRDYQLLIDSDAI